MNDATEIITKSEVSTTETNGKPSAPGSSIFGVSVRGWLAVVVIVTVCAMGVLGRTVQEPLYTLSVAIVSFYYGQNIKSKP